MGSRQSPTILWPVVSSARPRIGVSRCLLGDRVRFDGGHKAEGFLLDVLSAHVEWVAVCPEVEVGMGLPRESVRLLASRDGVAAGHEHVRMVGVRSGRDWTSRMAEWSADRAATLIDLELSGFVLKRDSPSCGLTDVRVHHPRSAASRTGRGIFAQALVDACPSLPMEDETRLRDAKVRAHFIERVFAYMRVTRFFRGRWDVGALMEFHTAHKLQLLSHSRVRYRKLGGLVADAEMGDRAGLAARYKTVFMDALAVPSTPGRHADVMLHMLGHLKGSVTPANRQEILQLIDAYRSGMVSQAVPLTSLGHHARRHRVGYLLGQTYLAPDSRELTLRSHA